MNRDAYFYLEMKEHELKVPYTGKNRRIRVLLPKVMPKMNIDTIQLYI